MKKIGFFGLGEMGSSIVHRLLDKGFKIVSTKRGKYNQFIKRKNFSVLNSPLDVANEAEIIILCVDTIDNLNKIILSKNGVIKAEHLPKFILDLGTGKPSNCKNLYNLFLKKNRIYVDMPIGRTPAHAKKGKLNLFISASKKKISKCSKIIEVISENQFYVNKIGEGTKIKLINNFYGQTVTLLFGKLLTTANKKNVNINNLVKIMSSGPLFSDILSAIKPYYEKNNEGSIKFSINNAFKDINYFKEEFGSDKLVDLVIKYFQTAIKKGHGKKSVAEVFKNAHL